MSQDRQKVFGRPALMRILRTLGYAVREQRPMAWSTATTTTVSVEQTRHFEVCAYLPPAGHGHMTLFCLRASDRWLQAVRQYLEETNDDL